eukprot:CAMPEP_0202858566 /NCGR_PEP_ID=MMETSP1391-20130828/1043_1 /ASSEMBLY_ACC=CAM_ASM_000867 /TAXON_ID=1034604 /ORGANISM="Chlamydomonas leiostraca, Strain SAG 11-49" /LENGTH=229 /DNA_ID=CAMNT_0049537493 /DNA_START=140 /DNA_END=829 /DNA_ORIENTATION=-
MIGLGIARSRGWKDGYCREVKNVVIVYVSAPAPAVGRHLMEHDEAAPADHTQPLVSASRKMLYTTYNSSKKRYKCDGGTTGLFVGGVFATVFGIMAIVWSWALYSPPAKAASINRMQTWARSQRWAPGDARMPDQDPAYPHASELPDGAKPGDTDGGAPAPYAIDPAPAGVEMASQAKPVTGYPAVPAATGDYSANPAYAGAPAAAGAGSTNIYTPPAPYVPPWQGDKK